MMFYVVPDYIEREINAKLDAALAECPDAAPDRELFYGQLLNYVNEHGIVPDFSLAKGQGK